MNRRHDVSVKTKLFSVKFIVHCKTCRKKVQIDKWNEAMVLAIYHHETGKWGNDAEG